MLEISLRYSQVAKVVEVSPRWPMNVQDRPVVGTIKT
jgi:hypothetical protein